MKEGRKEGEAAGCAGIKRVRNCENLFRHCHFYENVLALKNDSDSIRDEKGREL